MAEDRNLILAFESSCDETSVAVIENGNKILSNIVATQIKSHKRFGGVVPEVASRHHIEQVTYCIDDALCEANVDYDDLDAVAVTYGPGLVCSLLVGVTAAKTVAYAHDLPLVPVITWQDTFTPQGLQENCIFRHWRCLFQAVIPNWSI